jgi:hypothetical protein
MSNGIKIIAEWNAQIQINAFASCFIGMGNIVCSIGRKPKITSVTKQSI